MARPGGNPDCKGNKNSGRKPAYIEKDKIFAVNKLWEKVREKVESSQELTEYEEKLVLAVLPKTIKNQTDITTGGDKIQPIINLKDYGTFQGDNSNTEDNSTKE